jgi:diguanylate cyclase (GGDEF)-like protein/putative nucleotidyltransferase with HDIG domain
MMGSQDKWAARGSVAGLLVVLCFVGGFSLWTQNRVAADSTRADTAIRLSATYQDARHWVTEAKSIERRYHFEGSGVVRDSYEQATQHLDDDLMQVLELDASPASRATIGRLLDLSLRYDGAAHLLFAAIDRQDTAALQHLDHEVIDPIFGVLEYDIHLQAREASDHALDHSAALRRHQAHATRAMGVAFGIGLALLACFAYVLWRLRRAEVARLAQIALSDPLTGLRNHRAFQEDLARELQRVGRSGEPLAVVMLDVDDLKAVNDTLGHQAGDERLQEAAGAIRDAHRASDLAYRIGGDEFAAILTGSRALGALEFAERLRAVVPVTAGIAEATALRGRDEVIREADLALIGAKRLHQDAVIYGPDIVLGMAGGGDEHHERTLASALARAVDAKDSYTRSHCQTVSQLSAVIAAELGLDGVRVARVRLAGLLHDVGKIGVPDAILNKPAALTDDEFEQMKRHSLLGCDIVEAAEMHDEARWVRHHHERFDGGGYPDGLAGEDIPLESRIILVADAFEAMTSDRPYRRAPGAEFAIAELLRNAGGQFDPRVVDALCRALDRESAVLTLRGTS